MSRKVFALLLLPVFRVWPFILMLVLTQVPAQSGWAQSLGTPSSPVLVIAQDRLFTESKVGREIVAQDTVRRDRLRAESKKIDASFEEEEKQLTEQRATLSKEEFRAFAVAFDARVVAARASQEEKSQDILREMEGMRRSFFLKAVPILQQIMSDYNAVILVDQRSVLLSDNRINITDEAIGRLNKNFDSIADITGQ